MGELNKVKMQQTNTLGTPLFKQIRQCVMYFIIGNLKEKNSHKNKTNRSRDCDYSRSFCKISNYIILLNNYILIF